MRRRAEFSLVVLVVLGAIFAPLVAACDRTSRQDTLRVSFASTSAACEGMHAWDTARQEQIVAAVDPATTTKEAAQKRIADHRASMDKLYAGCALTLTTIGAASLGKDDLTLKTAIAEVARLLDAIRAMKGAL